MFGLGATAFAGGLMIGSFLTVVASRVPEGRSIMGPRSECPGCGAQIAARDNIPVLSWLMLRGRSRCCGQKISARYPLMELALGALFVLITVVLADDPAELVMGLVFASTLVAVTVTDLERRIIPNKILAVSAVFGLGLALATDTASVPERLAWAVGAGGLLFVAALAYPRGMGMGDVKLTALMGLYLGSSVAPALLIALFSGSLVGIGMMARHGAAARKQAVPFGPFLALGGVIALLVGPELIDWYLDTFA